MGLKIWRVTEVLRLPLWLQCVPSPISPRQAAQREGGSREHDVIWLVPWGFSVSQTVVDRLYAGLWSRSGNSEATTLCQGAAAAVPSVPTLHVENSCVVRRGMWWHSCGCVLLSISGTVVEVFLWFYLAAGFFWFFFSLKKVIVLFWDKTLRNYINHMKYKYIFSPIA